jgi:hypothetical protein
MSKYIFLFIHVYVYVYIYIFFLKTYVRHYLAGDFQASNLSLCNTLYTYAYI